jgi:hypothetical protein
MIRHGEGALETSTVRRRFDDALCRVRDSGERIVLRRKGVELAAFVPIGDLNLLRAIEDQIDVESARKALRGSRRHSLDAVKKALRL